MIITQEAVLCSFIWWLVRCGHRGDPEETQKTRVHYSYSSQRRGRCMPRRVTGEAQVVVKGQKTGTKESLGQGLQRGFGRAELTA